MTTTTKRATTDASLPYCSQYVPPTGSCSLSSSPYEPTFFTNSTTTNFEYAITQSIVCESGKMALVCGSGYVIHVYSAYFGIQEQTQSLCAESVGEVPAKCYFPAVYSQIKNACEYQSACSLTATSASFSLSDPCPSYSKQLFIQYQCVDILTLDSTISQCSGNKTVPLICPALSGNSSTLEATACDTSYAPMNLTCPREKTIKITCAFYGLHPSIIAACSLPTNVPVCYFSSSFTLVNSTCSGQQSCSITFLNSFADPCSGIDKALYVQYTCI